MEGQLLVGSIKCIYAFILWGELFANLIKSNLCHIGQWKNVKRLIWEIVT